MIRKVRSPLLALLLIIVTVVGCEEAGIEVGEDDEGTLVLGRTEVEEVVTRGVTPGNRILAFEGFRGHVRLEGTNEESASLEFTKRARGDDTDHARQTLQNVEVDETGADDEYLYRMSASQPERSAVDVQGTIPHNARLRIAMESGTITLSGVSGPVDIETQNGNVHVAGAAAGTRIRVQNGAVDLGMRQLPQEAEIDVQTQNGNITFTVPGQASARVEASTQAGNIQVAGLDFANRQLSPQGAGARFTGQLGTGQAPVNLQTQNGTIRLQEGMVERVTPEADTLQDDFPHFPDTEVEQDTLDQDTLRPQTPSDTVSADTADVPSA